jgi:site-specific recombinase XerD
VTPIAPHVTAFLQQRLPLERKASDHTCDAYAYALQLLLQFASRKVHVAPSDLQIEQIDAPLVLEFLDHLQTSRGNSPVTRNARLAAIKSFLRFVEYRVPSVLEQLRRVFAIPPQRMDRRLVRHLSIEEYRAVLDSPDPATRLGIRDRAMLHLALTGGLRVSELVSLRLDQVSFEDRYLDVRILGKGRKERALKLWRAVATSLRAWLAVRGQASCPEVFLNARGEPMTRSGFEHVLRRHVVAASGRVPTLQKKRVTPHVLRHTCALNMLRATKDIRKVALWLGHSSTQTTEVYLEADPEQKLDLLASTTAPTLRPGKFRPSDRLIASLRRS